MSSRAVRSLFREWATTISTPFVETINEEHDMVRPICCTALFNVWRAERISFCKQSRVEEGEISLIYFAPPGTGDDAVLQSAEADVAALMQKVDPTGRFTLTDHGVPQEFSSGDADSTYRMEVSFHYSFYS